MKLKIFIHVLFIIFLVKQVSVQIPVMLTTLFRFMLTSHFDV